MEETDTPETEEEAVWGDGHKDLEEVLTDNEVVNHTYLENP